jgi:hypothetical protein
MGAYHDPASVSPNGRRHRPHCFWKTSAARNTAAFGVARLAILDPSAVPVGKPFADRTHFGMIESALN